MRHLVALVVLAALLVSCGTPQAIIDPTAAVVTPVAATAAPTAVAVAPTAVVTNAPKPTDVPVPTSAPTATTLPDTPAARYIAAAQAGVAIPIVRTAGMPKGEWKADVIDNGNGPEVTLTMPVGIGLTTAQMLRQAKRQVAQAVKAIFDTDSTVSRVSVIGTLPDGNDGSELGAVSIFVTRAKYGTWDGTAENLGEWRIPSRYQ